MQSSEFMFNQIKASTHSSCTKCCCLFVVAVVVVYCEGESCLPLFAGSVLSPLGVASMHSYGSLDLDDDKVITSPSPEGIGVIGIGMFVGYMLSLLSIYTRLSFSNLFYHYIT